MSSEQIRFNGRVAIVTGAGAGFGREYALLLAERGAKVVVNESGGTDSVEGASAGSANLVVNEIKLKGGIAVADHNSVVDGAKIVETAINNFGCIDIIINNAGILRDRSILKITEQDWDLVRGVRLKSSFKVTQAAWPHMKKQNYGRIIMTSSDSGIYGSFGQANCSAAKMVLIGLANTVAIEGEKYNIHCNVIIPTTASRLTRGILPDLLFDDLKPQLIVPVVGYLCHESCEDNGSYIESAAGWAAKIHSVRGKSCVLRASIGQDMITPEYVKSVWSKVTNMKDAQHVNSFGDVSGYLLEVMEKIKQSKIDGFQDNFKYGAKDLILYALGIGATVKNANDLKFLYENHPDFHAIPSFFVLPGLLLSLTTNLVASALPERKADLTNVLHGEQYLEICDELPTSGNLTSTGQVFDIMGKSAGAIVVTNTNSFDENGRLLVKNQSSIFVVGAGKFGGKNDPIPGVIPIVNAPKRPPDDTIRYNTSEDQAALYHLSGDLNPLHIAPNLSMMAGFKTPILHGLCSMGFSLRAVLAKYANNNPSLFKCVKVRFAGPVIPGQTLQIDMWQESKRIHFLTNVVETGKNVITGAYVDLKQVIASL
uniref:Uncharacterized protein n=1 Tax=Glossina morsitans morsitans TaxID=37546 RepID=A0A1B0G798_GLOMM